MKALLSFCFAVFSSSLFAQADTALKPVEAGRKSSFEQYELLILAVLGLALLMGIRYWFRRTRKR